MLKISETRRLVFLPVVIVPLMFAAAMFAQSRQPYPKATTDKRIRKETPMAPRPVNVVFHDPDFGSRMVRATDETTDFKHPGSYLRNAATAEANEWSLDARKFYVIGRGGLELAFGFDPSTMAISSLPRAVPEQGLQLPLRPGSSFSFVDPDLIYGTTALAPLTISSYRFSTATIASLIDTTTCGAQPTLIQGKDHSVVSDDDVTLSANDNRIAISEGGPKSGEHMFVIVYDKKRGCRWYNTQTGQIGGQWGTRGKASVQTSYLIRHSSISGSGRYVRIQVNYFGFYIWDVATLKVVPCPIHGGPHCGGYGAMGYNSYVNDAGTVDQMNILLRPLGNLPDYRPLVYPLPSPHHFGQTKHYVWNNGYLDDTRPVCASTYNYEGDTSIDAPYDGEIVCIETDGQASTVWRFAHNRAIWTSPFFNTQPLGNITLDGRYFLFTSGWDGRLGNDSAGSPRSDVWIVKLD
jgi:hypothetical protein